MGPSHFVTARLDLVQDDAILAFTLNDTQVQFLDGTTVSRAVPEFVELRQLALETSGNFSLPEYSSQEEWGEDEQRVVEGDATLSRQLSSGV